MDKFILNLATQINNGMDLWTNDETQGWLETRQKFCVDYLPLFSNSQPAESAVKEAKNVLSSTGRDEELQSIYASGRPSLLPSLPSSDDSNRGKQNEKIYSSENKKHKLLLV